MLSKVESASRGADCGQGWAKAVTAGAAPPSLSLLPGALPAAPPFLLASELRSREQLKLKVLQRLGPTFCARQPSSWGRPACLACLGGQGEPWSRRPRKPAGGRRAWQGREAMFPPGGGGKGGGNGNAVARKVIHPERLLPAPAGPSEGRTSPRRAALGRAGVGEEETRGPDGRPSGGVALACTPPVPTGHLRQTSSQMHGPGRKEAAGAGASGQPPLPCPSLSPPAHTRAVSGRRLEGLWNTGCSCSQHVHVLGAVNTACPGHREPLGASRRREVRAPSGPPLLRVGRWAPWLLGHMLP